MFLPFRGAHVHPKEPATRDQYSRGRISLILLTSSLLVQSDTEKIAALHGWTTFVAGAWSDIPRLAAHHETGVVLIDRDMLQNDWKDGLRLLLRPEQRCCAILLNSLPTDRLSQEFIREGGYAVLEPFLVTPLVHAVRCAWAIWRHCLAPVHKVQ